MTITPSTSPGFNPQLEQFQPSAINKVFTLASRLKAEGVDVVDLSIGEPNFDTPAHVKQAAISAIHANNTKYTPSDGDVALKRAIIAKFERDNGLRYTTSEIAVDSGVKPLLFHVMKALLDADSEVIIPTPCWTSYPGMVMLAGARPVFVRCSPEQGFKLQAADLEAAITPATRLVMINSPGNPTGAAYSADELKPLTDVLLRHPHVWVLADDIYEHIMFDGFVHANPAAVEPRLLDRTIVLNGVSKAYGMTGWRIGYAGGPEPVMRALLKVLSQATGCASAISQAAAIAALEGPQDYLKEWALDYQQRRDLLVRRLAGVRGVSCTVPEGAFYLYPSIAGLIGSHTPQGRRIGNSVDFATYLLEHGSLAVVPGVAFEYDPHVRLSYAAPMAALETACDRFEAAVLALR